MILDEKSDFKSHIREAILKARRGKDDPHMTLDVIKRLEQKLYSASLAIPGAWRGTICLVKGDE